MATKIVTKESLQQMIDDAPKEMLVHVVGKALVGLFDRQTADEKAANHTVKHNNVGFTGADAKSGSLTARSYLARKTLADWQVEKWVKKNAQGYSRLAKYHSQLNEIAVAKAARKAAE